MSKIQKNIYTKMRPVGLINILKTKEWKKYTTIFNKKEVNIASDD